MLSIEDEDADFVESQLRYLDPCCMQKASNNELEYNGILTHALQALLLSSYFHK